VGLYGTLTGFSSNSMAVSEKVWANYAKLQNIYGYPWTFLLADIMRFDNDIDEALARIGGATRTCAIWVGLGQGAHPNPRDPTQTVPADFKLLGDSFEELHIYNDINFPVYPPYHNYYPQLVFVNKHPQPSKENCFNDLMGWGWGNLTAADFYVTVTALEQTGDMHIAVTDFDNKMWYVANASPVPAGGGDASPAYDNGFVQVNMTALWSEQAPARTAAKTSEITIAVA